LTISAKDWKRLEQLEREQERAAIPSILIHPSPTTAQLKPEIAAKLEQAGATLLILPIGRSAADDYGEADPQIAASRKYFEQ
jgi:hypothetical protein